MKSTDAEQKQAEYNDSYTDVINKRAGETGLISGRTAFQKPTQGDCGLLQAAQGAYSNEWVKIAKLAVRFESIWRSRQLPPAGQRQRKIFL